MRKPSKKALRERAAEVVRLLELRYPGSLCGLDYEHDYQLLIAVRLSAQCTDARVNQITPGLFAAYPTLQSLAEAELADLERIVHPCGFYRHKAKDIKESARLLLERHGGRVPDSMEALLALPGVGRKTANLLLGDLYGHSGCVVADTHCIRISGRLGLTDSDDPLKVETQLRALVDPDKSNDLCHRFVLFGREICKARGPQCGQCELRPLCPSAETAAGAAAGTGKKAAGKKTAGRKSAAKRDSAEPSGSERSVGEIPVGETAE
ncbi:MAG: endonuclease III [Clostridia bacterium]|nr:endonuclease III [Clostridia bacterium]